MIPPVHVTQVSEDVCVTQLRPGQTKRAPLDPGRERFGYYVVCPWCGQVAILSVVNGDLLSERAGRLVEAAFTCSAPMCGRRVVVRAGEFVEEEVGE
jgi:hypothetical protein